MNFAFNVLTVIACVVGEMFSPPTETTRTSANRFGDDTATRRRAKSRCANRARTFGRSAREPGSEHMAILPWIAPASLTADTTTRSRM